MSGLLTVPLTLKKATAKPKQTALAAKTSATAAQRRHPRARFSLQAGKDSTE